MLSPPSCPPTSSGRRLTSSSRRPKRERWRVFILVRHIYRSMSIPFVSERVKGIEPSYRLWKSRVLPLNYTRLRSFGTSAGKPALVIRCRMFYFSIKTLKLVGGRGFEPPASRSQTVRSSQLS